MATILLVDDDPATLEVINACLIPHYRTRVAKRGVRGLELARLQPAPDLLLLDLQLPDIHGFDVCATMKRDPETSRIPVIFLSGHSSIADITRGLELGAVDYVSKPVAPPILLARVRTHLRLQEAQRVLAERNRRLETMVSERTRDLEARTLDLQQSQEMTILALGSLAETRDNETGNHIQRTRAYVRALAGHLSRFGPMRDAMRPQDWEMIWKSAPLHDIGKVGIPDHILLKPGRLEHREFEIMKRHTILGRDAILAAEQRGATQGGFLRIAREIAYSHHERWDGNGYPEGISGAAIPLPARLMAIADVYDALTSVRVYKGAFPHRQTVDMIREERGRHFDPDVTACFLEISDEFDEIARQLADASSIAAAPPAKCGMA